MRIGIEAMGKPTGFKELPRETPKRRPVNLRILDWNEIYIPFGDKKQHEKKLQDQGARCQSGPPIKPAIGCGQCGHCYHKQPLSKYAWVSTVRE